MINFEIVFGKLAYTLLQKKVIFKNEYSELWPKTLDKKSARSKPEIKSFSMVYDMPISY